MKPLIVLLGSFAATIVILKLSTKSIDFQLAGRIAMASMLIFTSVGHFIFTEGMSLMIPNSIPLKREMVLFTGVLEILMAIGLLIPTYKAIVGWIIIGFLVLMLPMNVYASLNQVNYQTATFDGPGPSYLWFRVPLQFLFVVWVYLTSIKVVN